MLGRPSKKTLTVEQQKAIEVASSHQTGSMVSPKTYDPNYPLFSIPVNQKVLIYIPNHVTETEDGGTQLRADRYTAHQARIGKAFHTIRCIGEISNEALGWDGTCPLCDGTQYCWDLYNKQYDELARSKGVDKSSPEAESLLKEDRKTLLREMAISPAEKWITFCIVVIDCQEGTTKPKVDENGGIKGTPMFYSVRQSTYDDKWKSAFDALDDDDTGDGSDMNPAGRLAILNFMYTPKSGSHNKRDSARNMKVSFKPVGENMQKWAVLWDKETEGWDVAKMQEVLVQNAIRSMDEQADVAEELLKPTKDKLAMYALSGGTAVATASNVGAEAALAQFGAEAANTEASDEPVEGELPQGNVGISEE